MMNKKIKDMKKKEKEKEKETKNGSFLLS
jgi:hypothetical protein